MSKLTLQYIKNDVGWTKEYISELNQAVREKRYEDASRWANEISAIWATISGMCEDKQIAKELKECKTSSTNT